MSWLDRFAAELSSRGLQGSTRRRILIELRDHIECEPGCEERLGDPQELAEAFADELATDSARRSAIHVFAALAVAAVALVVPQLALGGGVGYPGFNNGLSLGLFFPALIGLFVLPQVALVAGTLAAWRSVRRRRERSLPEPELALIRRRSRVALGAGYGVVAGVALYTIDFSSKLPVWWLTMSATLAAVAGTALLGASRSLMRAGAVVSGAGGKAGDVYDDLPMIRMRWLRRHPWLLGLLVSLMAMLVMTAFEAHAEHSWAEGLQRGVVEGLAAGLGFLALGRVIGVNPGPTRSEKRLRAQVRRAIGAPAQQLVADRDRSRAELVLRDSFAAGRLSVDDLTTRVAAVHGAETIDELRAALRGLPEVEP